MSYQREFERKVRIGVVGLGSHSYRNLLPTLTFLPVEVAAFCDVNEEILQDYDSFESAQVGISEV